MTVSMNIKSNIDQVTRDVGRFYAKQVPFAASVALNETAREVRKVEQAAAKRELDDPTPSTLKGIRVQRSTKRNLEASVFIIKPVDKYMRYQIHGGTDRPERKFEAIPVNVRLNRYGNIPGRRKGKIKKLLARKDTFAGEINGVRGVWQRGRAGSRSRLKLLLAFEARMQYRPRFDFYGHANRTASRRWPRKFSMALSAAIRSAR